MPKVTNKILEQLAQKLVTTLIDRNLSITAAESCTGGLVASFITHVSGSSACFNGSFVTYSNTMKRTMIGVSRDTLKNHGAVSKECVAEMITGAAMQTEADISIAISGIAGPTGGTDEKPVGTVYIGVWFDGESRVEHFNFSGDRAEVRLTSVYEAFCMALSILSNC